MGAESTLTLTSPVLQRSMEETAFPMSGLLTKKGCRVEPVGKEVEIVL